MGHGELGSLWKGRAVCRGLQTGRAGARHVPRLWTGALWKGEPHAVAGASRSYRTGSCGSYCTGVELCSDTLLGPDASTYLKKYNVACCSLLFFKNILLLESPTALSLFKAINSLSPFSQRCSQQPASFSYWWIHDKKSPMTKFILICVTKRLYSK